MSASNPQGNGKFSLDGGAEAAMVTDLVELQKKRIKQLVTDKQELLARVKAAEALGEEIETCLAYANDLRVQIAEEEAAEARAERDAAQTIDEAGEPTSFDVSPVSSRDSSLSPPRRRSVVGSAAAEEEHDTSRTVHHAIGELEDIISTIEEKEGTMIRIWSRIFAIQKVLRKANQDIITPAADSVQNDDGGGDGDDGEGRRISESQSPRHTRRGSGDAVQALAALENEILEALRKARLAAPPATAAAHVQGQDSSENLDGTAPPGNSSNSGSGGGRRQRRLARRKGDGDGDGEYEYDDNDDDDEASSSFSVISQKALTQPHKFQPRSIFSQRCKTCKLTKSECLAAQAQHQARFDHKGSEPKLEGTVTLDDGHISVVIGSDRKIDGSTTEERWAQRWMVIREEYQKLQSEVVALQQAARTNGAEHSLHRAATAPVPMPTSSSSLAAQNRQESGPHAGAHPSSSSRSSRSRRQPFDFESGSLEGFIRSGELPSIPPFEFFDPDAAPAIDAAGSPTGRSGSRSSSERQSESRTTTTTPQQILTERHDREAQLRANVEALEALLQPLDELFGDAEELIAVSSGTTTPAGSPRRGAQLPQRSGTSTSTSTANNNGADARISRSGSSEEQGNVGTGNAQKAVGKTNAEVEKTGDGLAAVSAELESVQSRLAGRLAQQSAAVKALRAQVEAADEAVAKAREEVREAQREAAEARLVAEAATARGDAAERAAEEALARAAAEVSRTVEAEGEAVRRVQVERDDALSDAMEHEAAVRLLEQQVDTLEHRLGAVLTEEATAVAAANASTSAAVAEQEELSQALAQAREELQAQRAQAEAAALTAEESDEKTNELLRQITRLLADAEHDQDTLKKAHEAERASSRQELQRLEGQLRASKKQATGAALRDASAASNTVLHVLHAALAEQAAVIAASLAPSNSVDGDDNDDACSPEGGGVSMIEGLQAAVVVGTKHAEQALQGLMSGSAQSQSPSQSQSHSGAGDENTHAHRRRRRSSSSPLSEFRDSVCADARALLEEHDSMLTTLATRLKVLAEARRLEAVASAEYRAALVAEKEAAERARAAAEAEMEAARLEAVTAAREAKGSRREALQAQRVSSAGGGGGGGQQQQGLTKATKRWQAAAAAARAKAAAAKQEAVLAEGNRKRTAAVTAAAAALWLQRTATATTKAGNGTHALGDGGGGNDHDHEQLEKVFETISRASPKAGKVRARRRSLTSFATTRGEDATAAAAAAWQSEELVAVDEMGEQRTPPQDADTSFGQRGGGGGGGGERGGRGSDDDGAMPEPCSAAGADVPAAAPASYYEFVLSKPQQQHKQHRANHHHHHHHHHHHSHGDDADKGSRVASSPTTRSAHEPYCEHMESSPAPTRTAIDQIRDRSSMAYRPRVVPLPPPPHVSGNDGHSVAAASGRHSHTRRPLPHSHSPSSPSSSSSSSSAATTDLASSLMFYDYRSPVRDPPRSARNLFRQRENITPTAGRVHAAGLGFKSHVLQPGRRRASSAAQSARAKLFPFSHAR